MSLTHLRTLSLLIPSLTAFCGHSQPYTFATLAGTPGVSGTNDGISQSAEFSFPVGVVPDPAGNLYVADFLNHAIRKMTPEGSNWVVTTIAGLPGAPGYADGTNSEARFNRPAGITIDSTGNLFVAERYNHTIRKVTPSGTNWVVSTVAGQGGVPGNADGTNTQAQFYLPSGITIDTSNHLFVADTANFTIREITPIGTDWAITTVAGTPLVYGFTNGLNGDAQFNYPYGIAISSAGKLYIADSGNHAIREMTRSGSGWMVNTIGGFSGMSGTADGAGTVAAFNFPTGVAVNNGGQVFVADQSNNSIRKMTPAASDWTVSTLAGQPQRPGSTDATGTNALFKKPWGVAVDSAGDLFVADYANSTIRKGTFPSSSLPALQILVLNNQVVLSWPGSASNYVLESSAALSQTIGWLPVTNNVFIAQGNLVYTNSMDAASAFYRLRYLPGQFSAVTEPPAQ